jgi:hypothetical protein
MTRLSLGIVLGGPELEDGTCDKVLARILNAVADNCPINTGIEGAMLNVVFHVPGTLFGPDFSGLRVAKFSRARAILLVQVAVPTDLVSEMAIRSFAYTSIRRAIDIAARVFSKVKIPYSAEELHNFFDQVERDLV